MPGYLRYGVLAQSLALYVRPSAKLRNLYIHVYYDAEPSKTQIQPGTQDCFVDGTR
jgi:uncharacterized protein YutE (UPF0331/DUF86 family)